MGYQDLLRELATEHSIATGYTAYGGHYLGVTDDTLIKILHCMGVDLGLNDYSVDDLAAIDFDGADYDKPSRQRFNAATTRSFPGHSPAVS